MCRATETKEYLIKENEMVFLRIPVSLRVQVLVMNRFRLQVRLWTLNGDNEMVRVKEASMFCMIRNIQLIRP